MASVGFGNFDNEEKIDRNGYRRIELQLNQDVSSAGGLVSDHIITTGNAEEGVGIMASADSAATGAGGLLQLDKGAQCGREERGKSTMGGV